MITKKKINKKFIAESKSSKEKINSKNINGKFLNALEQLKVHDHLCLIYETQEEQFAAVIPFMRIGLERSEKCVYIADDNTAASVLNAMRTAGIDVDTAIEKGALAIITKHEAYLKQGFFDPDWMIDFLKKTTEQAKASGFSALRVTGEMTWMLGGDPGVERLIEYESKLNYAFPVFDVLAICQYNKKRFSPAIIKDIISTHPLLVYGETVCKNFYYVPPDEFLAVHDDKSSTEVDRLLKNILDREKVELTLEESEIRYRGLFEDSPISLWEEDFSNVKRHIDDLRASGVSDFRAYFEEHPEEVAQCVNATKIIAVNQATLKLFKADSKERLLEGLNVIFSKESFDIFKEELITFAGGVTQFQSEAILKNLANEKLYTVVRLSIAPGYENTWRKVFVSVDDITERKKVEEEFENLFNMLPDLVCVADLNTATFINVNPAFTNVLGYSKDEFLGRSFINFIHPDDKQQTIDVVAERLKMGELVSGFINRYKCKDGTYKWLEWSALSLPNRNLMYTAARDITERKLAENELMKFKFISDNSADAHFLIGRDAKFKYVNETSCRILGYSKDELLKLGVPDVDIVYDSKKYRELFDLIQHKTIPPIETINRRKNGSVFPAELTVTGYKIAGEPFMFAALRNITERKHEEKVLQETESRLRAVLSNAPITIFALDSHGVFTLSEGKALERAGLKPGENVGVSAFDLFGSLPFVERTGKVTVGQDVIHRALAGETVIAISELGGVTFENHIGPIFDKDGKVVGIVGVATDITERKRAEEELRASEERFAAAFRFSPLPMAIYRPTDGHIVNVNDAFVSTFGHAREEVINHTTHELQLYVDLEDRNTIRQILQERGSLENFEFSMRRKSGEILRVLNSARLIEFGGEKHYLSLILDITERKRAEEALRESEHRFRLLYERAPVAYQSLNAEGKILEVNNAWLKQLGYDLDEVIGHPISEFLVPEHIKLLQERFPKFLSEGEVHNAEFNFVRKDGKIITVSVEGRIGYDEHGKFKQTHCILHNITERKRVEEELLRAHDQLLEAQRITHSGSWETDFSSGKIIWSDEMYRIYGVDRGSFGHTREALLELIHPEDRHILLDSFKTILSGKQNITSHQLRIVHPDGSIHFVESSNKAYFDSSGKPIRVLGVTHDITERKRTEEKLMHLHQQNELILSSSAEGILGLDLQGNHTFINPSAARMLGYKAEELLGSHSHSTWHHTKPDGSPYPKEECAIYAAYRDGAVHHVSTEVFWRKDGTCFPVEYSSTPIFEHGRLLGAVVTFADITERKQAEDALRKLSRAVEQSPASTIITDTTGAIEYANPKFTELTGYTLEEIIGKNPRILKSGKTPPDVYVDMWRTLSRGGVWRGEFCNKKKNEELYREAVSISPIMNEAGIVTHYVAVKEDITERKHSEEALRMAEEKYRSIFENSVEGIFQSTASGKFITVNPAMARMLGYESPKELIAKITDIEQQLYVDPKKRQEMARVLEERGIVERFESQLYRKDGKKIWISENGRAVRDERGIIQFYEGAAEDITEKKQLESQFLRAQRLESIGTLAGGIAHDLNNVLAPILLGVELVRKKVTDESAKSLLNTIESSALRGSDLIKQVLSFARGVEGERTIVQVRHLINEIGKVINETFPKAITFRLDLIKELWPIMGDATQLHQVLMNICINARDAMLQGGTLEIKAENILLDKQYTKMDPEAKEGAYIVLSVTDTGTGIPDEVIGKIFEPFFTTKEISKGTGLGLSTVNAIVKAHNGLIKVQSKIGKGTTFKIYLPALTTQESEKAISQVVTKPSGNGELVLVVDDEAAVREITRATLEAYNYRVITANDGTEAVVIFAEHKNEIAVVLTDMVMPFMDGTATIRAMQKINPAVKIIAMSGFIQKASVIQSSDSPDVKFLQKPYNAETLLVMLHQLLRNNK